MALAYLVHKLVEYRYQKLLIRSLVGKRISNNH